MPFSRENRKYSFMFLAIGASCVTTIIGAVYLIQHDKQAAGVWTGGGVLVTYLLGFVRAEVRANDASKDRTKITDKVDEIERKTNGNLTRAIRHVAEEVRAAKNEPAPGQEQMPRTPDELQSLLKLFARSMCDDIAREAACAAAVKAREEMEGVAARASEAAATRAGELAARTVIEEMRRQIELAKGQQ